MSKLLNLLVCSFTVRIIMMLILKIFTWEKRNEYILA